MLFYKAITIVIIMTLVLVIINAVKNKRISYKKDVLLTYSAVLFSVICVELSMVSENEATKIFWNEFKFIAVVFIPLLVFRMNLCFLEIKKFMELKYVLIYSIFPVVILILIATNKMHHLFRKYIFVVNENGIDYIVVQSGIAFIIHSAYQYIIMIALLAFLIAKFFKLPKIYRMQLGIMVASMIFCIITIILVATGVIVDYGDLSIIAIAVAGLIQYYAIAIYKPSAMVFLSRSNAISDIDNEILIFDTDNNLIDANKKAIESFELSEVASITYKKFANMLNLPRTSNITCEEYVIGNEIFDITDKMMIDDANKVCGRVLSFKNISNMKSLMNEMEIVASLDYLTGLKNRRAFLRLLDEYDKIDEMLPISIICFSISGMKQLKIYNDDYTYENTIVCFSELLESMCENRFECAAINAYDFGVIMSEATEIEAMSFAENVKEKFLELLDGKEGNFKELGVVYGISVKTNPRQSINSTFRKANEIVYRNLLLYC